MTADAWRYRWMVFWLILLGVSIAGLFGAWGAGVKW
jgi:hypothetical protein